ncbi:MAG: putative nucleic acid-binding protein, contains domain [Ignavibacteria bacterium]|nr:putative nucleic acid-binding protein, contains domain [Ignavibacteria bacterium]
MDKVLIDTDVILDFFFDRNPFSEHAAKIFSLCDLKIIKGFITPVICNNVYFLLKRTANHEKVIEKLTKLISITEVLIIDNDIIIQAMISKFKDFEDALQNFAAEKSGNIDLILTRNTKDFKHSKLGVMTPENYLKSRTTFNR